MQSRCPHRADFCTRPNTIKTQKTRRAERKTPHGAFLRISPCFICRFVHCGGVRRKQTKAKPAKYKRRDFKGGCRRDKAVRQLYRKANGIRAAHMVACNIRRIVFAEARGHGVNHAREYRAEAEPDE